MNSMYCFDNVRFCGCKWTTSAHYIVLFHILLLFRGAPYEVTGKVEYGIDKYGPYFEQKPI